MHRITDKKGVAEKTAASGISLLEHFPKLGIFPIIKFQILLKFSHRKVVGSALGKIDLVRTDRTNRLALNLGRQQSGSGASADWTKFFLISK